MRVRKPARTAEKGAFHKTFRACLCGLGGDGDAVRRGVTPRLIHFNLPTRPGIQKTRFAPARSHASPARRCRRPRGSPRGDFIKLSGLAIRGASAGWVRSLQYLRRKDQYQAGKKQPRPGRVSLLRLHSKGNARQFYATRTDKVHGAPPSLAAGLYF